ncbi:hypothetical protein P8C59_008104 [Phyllachora maydis]|uniref:Palmitoyltransferase PFA4 n=1 Tax=Phyllachora maydis TaxID=1825666 RepID=A0AAD9ME90_9PEZI|nr:hypothetical protein P8C59_008104 [Phyllachora maydis]
MGRSVKTASSTPGFLQVLAIPAACCLIFFLSYYPQWLLNAHPVLQPGPMTTRETVVFNSLVGCVWYTYYKACTVDPGRFPPAAVASASGQHRTGRWCKKCQAPKPPRAHHCRHCARCIPKMDHHCPWTGTCVSLQTFPHFLRALAYANAAVWTLLLQLLWPRLHAVWAERHLPAYLGPTLPQLVLLVFITLTAAATALGLAVLLYTTARACVLNTTMIEGWEMERHEAVMARRADQLDLDFDADTPDPLRPVEFPYDIGFLANVAQAMGTRNPLLWAWPFAGGPVLDPTTPGRGPGWEWAENGFNARLGMWPPPDPEKRRRARAPGWPGASATAACRTAEDDQDVRAAFARRQEADRVRRRQAAMQGRSGIIAELEELDALEDVEAVLAAGRDDEFETGMDGEPGWTNSDGDRLRDYGVDEEPEEPEGPEGPEGAEGEYVRRGVHDDDDDVPIAELLRRRKAHGRAAVR